MNRSKEHSVANFVRSRVLTGGEDRVWTYADFARIERMPLAAALSRLTKEGHLTRIRRGVYYRPRATLFGLSRPDPEALVDAVLRHRGERAIPAGVEHYSRPGLTTQLSGAITRAARRRVRRDLVPENLLPGVVLRVSSRPLDRQRGIRPEERTALDALRDIGRIPGSSPGEVLTRLKALLDAGKLDFARLARFARVEPPRVRALLGALGEDIRKEGSRKARVPVRTLESLHRGLNPLTTYRVRDADTALAHAGRWRVVGRVRHGRGAESSATRV